MTEEADGEKIGKLSGIVPEVWHDLIARIIPGLLVTYMLYEPTHDSMKSHTIAGFAWFLVAAYLIGLVIDLSSGGFVALIAWFIAKYNKGIDPCFSMSNYNLIDQLRSPRRELMVKMFAEVVLCRSLFFFSICQLIAGVWGSQSKPIKLVSKAGVDLHPNYIWSIVTLVAFLCWYRIGSATQIRFKIYLKDEDRKSGSL